MPVRYKWHPITDIEGDPNTLTDRELESLARIWARQKQELAEQRTLDAFNRRLAREWSIETGIIEDVYSIDRGTTATLIERGIDAALIPHDGDLTARIIQDHYEALERVIVEGLTMWRRTL